MTTGPLSRVALAVEARRFRDEEGLSYHGIAAALGVSYSVVVRLLDPEQARVRDAASNAKRTAAKRQWADAHDRGRCACGTVLGEGSKHAGRKTCMGCWQEMRRVGCAMRLQPVYDLWHAGASLREIAAAIGVTRNTMGRLVSDMRSEGWDMPHRYPAWDRKENSRCGSH